MGGMIAPSGALSRDPVHEVALNGNFRFGSEADMYIAQGHVCFEPEAALYTANVDVSAD